MDGDIITINGEEFELASLELNTQKQISRVVTLRNEIAALEMQINERNILLAAYGTVVAEAVKPEIVEKEETA
jgi:hypothetical protein